MEYKISKEELGNDWLYSTLIALDKCMAAHGLPLYVVGARARDVAMKLMKGDEPLRCTFCFLFKMLLAKYYELLNVDSIEAIKR